MTSILKAAMLAGAVAIAFGLSPVATAAQVVKPGDMVETAFSCWLSSGTLAATTDPTMTSAASPAKSHIFLPRQAAEPLVIPAGGGESVYGRPGERGFESDIVARIGQLVIGMAPGETRQAQLTAEKSTRPMDDTAVIQMAKVRERPKFMKMTPAEYSGRAHKKPVLGDAFTLDPDFPGRVTGVSDNQVTVEFSAEVGARIRTGIGVGEVRDAGKNWEVVIEAKRGDLVRGGGMVGRVVDVDERMITIDYSHPFGGEILSCDITVNRVVEVKP
jgi:FKBP-type peptidyl-prolyl cis-trans isomerase 2